MNDVLGRLKELGIELPAAPAAIGSYVPAVRAGDFVFTSGQLPLLDGSLLVTGIVGVETSPSGAATGARQCALNALAAALTVCRIEEIASVVKVTGYVASAPDFTGQPSVVNGASDVLVEIFGDEGRHAREAVGVAALPMGASVEVSVVFGVPQR